MKHNWSLADHEKKEPYKVPDGYFETLTSRVMSNIPENKEITIISREKHYRTIFYAAAAFIGITICSATLLLFSGNSKTNEIALEDSLYMEDMVDYTMMDYLTIHQYLTDASGE